MLEAEGDDIFGDEDDFLLSQIDVDYVSSKSVQNTSSSGQGGIILSDEDEHEESSFTHQKPTKDSGCHSANAELELLDDFEFDDDSSFDSYVSSKFFSDSKVQPEKPDQQLEDSNMSITSNGDSDSPRKVRKRRFPGPAGLLPVVKPAEISLLDKSSDVSKHVSKIINSDNENTTINKNSSSAKLPEAESNTPEDFTSQNEKLLLERQTWLELHNHLKMQSQECAALNNFNINWIQRNLHRFPTSVKIPFLLIILQDTPELNGPVKQFRTPCVRCRDSTGTIEVAIDYKFASGYASDLITGTSLAVQNVGLLRFSSGQIIVTITERNLICMFSALEEDAEENRNNSPSPNNSQQSQASGIVCSTPVNKPQTCKESHSSLLVKAGLKMYEFAEFRPDQIMLMYDKLKATLQTCK